MAKNFKELRTGMSAAAKAASAVEHRRLAPSAGSNPTAFRR